MSADYRSWEEREAAAAKTRAEAARIAAEVEAARTAGAQAAEAGAAKTATDLLAEQVKQAGLRKKLDAVKEAAKDEHTELKARRREVNADNGTAFKRIVNVAVVLGLLAALPAQLSYFLGLHKKGEESPGVAWLLGPIPIFLELLAWVGVLGTRWAHRKGLPRWPFWFLTAGLASIAGYINLAHGTDEYGIVAGVALAATSVIGPVLAEVRDFLEGRAAADTRSVERRAAEKAAAKREARAARELKKVHDAEDERRRNLFPLEFAEYERIIVAHPTGAVTREAAWRQAWDNTHLLPLATTADTLAGREDARAAINAVLRNVDRTPESEAVDRLLAEIFRSDGGDSGPSQKPAGDDPDGSAGGGSRVLRPADPKAPGALGRKGKRASGRTAGKTPLRPLEAAHLEAVRKLVDALGDIDRLSARKVREVIGGGSNEYAVRLRDAVKTELAAN
ncbi:hypothetical protein [Streptomyces poriferorum]|uniref:DUF2637 domain-containing protein n=1 Tax=Streptomyces poriferorum TaxID=2798799 RepID=A0ABY9J067_9ACTN|nr:MULTISPECIES: hypothetical protein [unclassified Streptomyces]MDP5310422.1 hypothetical protein [Streptomyces sp. Alt4]WLQ60424.1 hypothetical protein P8A19_35595 [Streptomyces sp. Alt2]